MAKVYIAEKRRMSTGRVPMPVPDYEGLGRWRWLATNPWWYFESEIDLDAPLAPDRFPNGEKLDVTNCIATWREVGELDFDPTELSELTDEQMKLAMAARGFTVIPKVGGL